MSQVTFNIETLKPGDKTYYVYERNDGTLKVIGVPIEKITAKTIYFADTVAPTHNKLYDKTGWNLTRLHWSAQDALQAYIDLEEDCGMPLFYADQAINAAKTIQAIDYIRENFAE